MAYITKYQSPLGEIVLRSENGLSLGGLWLETQMPIVAGGEDCHELELFGMVEQWLTGYFSGKRLTADGIPMEPKGTVFQERVWQRLRRIPYGETVSYGQLAKELECHSAQAIGQAVGKNPISILIPCHRVIGKNGSLTGYAGGLEMKRKILILEGILSPAEGI